MPRFSANLGFLWKELPLPDAIRAAGQAGFDAVECHWPYDTDPGAVNAALADTGLQMLGLNTRPGEPGQRGLLALVGSEREARDAISQALDYATAVGATAVHCMAGTAQGAGAMAAYLDNLAFAASKAEGRGITILIEPLNPHDAPGYFLNSIGQARDIIDKLAAPNLKLMFDCYHVGRTGGDVIAGLRQVEPIIGHIQFAAVPDRGPPDHGDVDYAQVFRAIDAMGWTRPLGAEYVTGGDTEATLGWMADPGPRP